MLKGLQLVVMIGLATIVTKGASTSRQQRQTEELSLDEVKDLYSHLN